MTELVDAPPQPADIVADALAEIAAGAANRDEAADPTFPHDAFDALQRAGLMTFNAIPGTPRPPAADELALVRRVAAADGSVGRIFDGHLNAVERIAVQGEGAVCERELRALAAGELWAGVWGGDPRRGEGDPARLVQTASGPALRGVKTFCSGAGGLHRALVLARAPDSVRSQAPAAPTPPLSAWVDLTARDHVEIDTSWYRSHGLRASVSHRVVFHDAPVLAVLGPPGAIGHQPWFARDALRTAASWAGMADAAADAAMTDLAHRPGRGTLEALAAGRMTTTIRTIDACLTTVAQAMDAAGPELEPTALHARVAIADAARTLLRDAESACGSHPFVVGSRLDRARRDLEVFLLQHRLDPLLARAGQATLDATEARWAR